MTLKPDTRDLYNDEPAFLLKGSDPLSLPVLQEYIDRANAMNLPMTYLRDLIQLSADIRYWQEHNREHVELQG